MKVLIVDDEPEVVALLGEMVTMLGHEVVAAENGREASEILERDPIRVVVTDWIMPEVDGLELIRRIRSTAGSRYVYVIMLTALGGTEHYLQGMAAGADDFVTKPVSPDELAARLRVAERILGLRDNVKLLEGLLSICMYCKKVHATETAWTSIERYVEERSDASFSHDVCPECFDTKIRPEVERLAGPGTPLPGEPSGA